MNYIISLDTSSIRYLIFVLGSKNIFQYLRTKYQIMIGQTKASIKHTNTNIKMENHMY